MKADNTDFMKGCGNGGVKRAKSSARWLEYQSGGKNKATTIKLSNISFTTNHEGQSIIFVSPRKRYK